MTSRISRRRFVALGLASGAGIVAVILSRDLGRDDRPTLPPELADVAWAIPWATLHDEAVDAFGLEVIRHTPEQVAHARDRLQATRDDARGSLRAAFATDATDAAFADVGGWLVPGTLAGLAGALAAVQG